MRFRPIKGVDLIGAALARYQIVQPYLLYIGGINARKNIARLLQGFAQVHTRHPQLRLVIGGKRQWQTSEIDAVFRQLDLGEAVHWTGYVRDEDLPALYSGAAAFLFPSLYEGFGLPVLEAMACGTPVITSNVSSLPEVAGDDAILVDPYDVGAIAAAIDRVFEQPDLAARLREQGLMRARQFTWERAGRQTVAVYESVLSASRPAVERAL
jgi:glycosyltransferase involved in cell wall biosynthesis